MNLAQAVQGMFGDEVSDPSIAHVLGTVISQMTKLRYEWIARGQVGRPSVNDYARVAYAELRSKYDV